MSNYAPQHKEDFRKIEDLSAFNSLVDNFVNTRAELKSNIDAAKGIEKVKRQDIEAQAKPVVEAIDKLKNEMSNNTLAKKPTYYSIFEKYSNSPSLRSSEVRYQRKGGKIIYKLGNMGLVDEANIQDDLIHITHMRSGEKMVKQLTPDLAQLLFVPAKDINFDEIADSQIVRYYELLNFAGFPKGSQGRNEKFKLLQAQRAKEVRKPSSPKERAVKVEEARQRVRERKMKEDEPKEEAPAEDVYEEEEAAPAVNLVDPRRKAGRKTRQSQRLKERPGKKGYGLGRRQKKMGRGFMSLDDMVSRLHLLASSVVSGNTSVQTENEMVDIIDRLYSEGVLAKNEVENLYSKYLNY